MPTIDRSLFVTGKHVKFTNNPHTWTVATSRGSWAVCTRTPVDVDDQMPAWCVVDLDLGIRSVLNTIGRRWPFDDFTPKNLARCLDALESGQVLLSIRRAVPATTA